MSVVIAYPHGWEKSAVFDECLHRLMENVGGRIDVARLPSFGVAGRLHDIRNQQVKAFLDQSNHEWLWLIDDDMAFAPNLLDLLLDAADPNERPVIGGLCFGQKILRFNEMMVPELSIFPTIYKWDPQGKCFSSASEYPDNAFVKVAGTGAACLLIHRKVLELVRENWGDVWFTPVGGAGGDPDAHFSEDLSFCGRLGQLEVPVYVHTGIKTGHQKPRWLTDELFRAQQTVKGERWVVIPTKNNLNQLRDLIGQLREQGEADGIVVVDNGMSRTGRNWLSSQKDLTVLEMPGAGIHHMWNAGADLVPDGADVAFLNDDLAIGPGFLSGLQEALGGSVVVSCPNYDGRTQQMSTTDICANRYDGTGGISGFAFMVHGPFLRSYSFPEDCMWWFGDNDLMLTVASQGLTGVVLVSPTVEHLDGGGQSGDWQSEEMKAQTDADFDAFAAKWGAVKVPA